ncbi:hypothetical protein [uncultured Aquimarina sp.]|uniref:hypothetical protein n=1 Tax=uncultured Aquimarina sp. TaxID=575652 RepID=UPI0026307B4F|nr:hypothetical protein [uncultured Aquimarina sp.]
MKHLKNFHLSILFLCFSFCVIAQDDTSGYIETEAVIKEINFKVRSRRSSATATVNYKTLEGDSLTSTVKLMHIPFIGALDKEGDRIKILYNKETPLLLTTKSTSFWQSYGLYLLIGFGIIILLYRFINRSKK